MKAKTSVTIALMLICTMLALPASALATPPEPLEIKAQLWLTGPASAAGIFTISGLFEDYGYDFGDASEVLMFADNTVHGVKTLVGEAGTITINFPAQMTWDPAGTASIKGRFVIVSGTGAYKKLHGVGETDAALDLNASYPNPNIVATYTGKAHFD